MDLATFLLHHGEFATVASATVQAVLTESEAQASDTWEGDGREEYVRILTAHNLSLLPTGRNSRQQLGGKGLGQAGGGKSPYAVRLQTLQDGHACAFRRWG